MTEASMEQRQAAVLVAQQRYLDEEETWGRKFSALEASSLVCIARTPCAHRTCMSQITLRLPSDPPDPP